MNNMSARILFNSRVTFLFSETDKLMEMPPERRVLATSNLIRKQGKRNLFPLIVPGIVSCFLFRTVSILLFACNALSWPEHVANPSLASKSFVKIKQTTNCKYNFRSPDNVSKLIRFKARYFD